MITDGAEAAVMANARVVGTVNKAKAAVKKTASKSVGVTGGKGRPKGPRPALYRDPKSGATWSGRGRAPAWLAGANDRTKFLVAGVDAAADAGVASKTKPSTKKAIAEKAVVKKVTVTKTAPTKKVAVKKVAAKKAASTKAPAKKAPTKSVAVPAAVAATESDAELAA